MWLSLSTTFHLVVPHPSRVTVPSCFSTDGWEFRWAHIFVSTCFCWFGSIFCSSSSNRYVVIPHCGFSLSFSNGWWCQMSVCPLWWRVSSHLLSILRSCWLFPYCWVLRGFFLKKKCVLDRSLFLDVRHEFWGLFHGQGHSVISRRTWYGLHRPLQESYFC